MHHRRVVARGQAHGRLQRERVVGRGAVQFHAKFLAQFLQQLIGAAQRTGQVVAEMDDVLADRLFVKEGVKTCHRAYLGRVEFEQLCDVVDRVVRQPAVLALRDVERGDDSGALGRIFRKVCGNFGARCVREHKRDTGDS